jgi:winged helix DNA-binding protein
VNETGVALSRRALNRALLERQLLLARRDLPILETIDRLVGMQAQEPQAPYLGLWTRLKEFDPEALPALIAAGAAVRGPLMRATIHLVSAADWQRLRPAVQPVLLRSFGSSPFAKRTATVDRSELLGEARILLAARPRSRAELGQLLAASRPGTDPLALAYAATYLEPVAQAPPRGLWRRSGEARWTGTPTAPDPLPVDELLFRYLAAFGPASVQDMQAWSGLTRLEPQIDKLRHQLRTFKDEQGRQLLDVANGPLPDPDTPAPPRFLPPFDNAILAHANRDRIISPDDRRRLSHDRLMRSFLIDGAPSCPAVDFLASQGDQKPVNPEGPQDSDGTLLGSG